MVASPTTPTRLLAGIAIYSDPVAQPQTAPVEPPATRAANAIAAGFEQYHARFQQLTRQAKTRFERRDWSGALGDATARLDLYATVIGQLEREVRAILATSVSDRRLWAEMKAVYSGWAGHRPDWEVAETFFNSVTRRIFATAGVDANIEYVDSDYAPPSPVPGGTLCRTYPAGGLEGLVAGILGDGWFDVAFADLTGDSRLAAAHLESQLRAAGIAVDAVEGAEILSAPFFRRKGAYLVGRVLAGTATVPLVLALLNTDAGLVLDAVLTDVDDVSILFSFTRSHFHVDHGPPFQLVSYLKSLMPRKPVAELYIALGYHKHGKTELYRDLLRRLRSGDDLLERAPGTPGMVMVVFTMPMYDVVFKVIRDHFPAIKPVTPATVRDNYRLVFRHDRAGRLVEAQEFEHLKFDLARVATDLLQEFRKDADRTVSVADSEVVVHHAYLERRVIPLDVYLRDADPAHAEAAVIDFGQAVKDLAANGIFPGELLPKNFGVTRHGRVVCYDYDELGLLTDFTFRTMPDPITDDDDFGEEAWFGVASRDVFPAEFRRFIGLTPEHLAVLDRHHADLYEVEFWQQMQARVKKGEIIDIFPYRAAARLHVTG
jgi:isocitrate dehydrogenase kinase/phosphatase